jgi:hypothetical protein
MLPTPWRLSCERHSFNDSGVSLLRSTLFGHLNGTMLVVSLVALLRPRMFSGTAPAPALGRWAGLATLRLRPGVVVLALRRRASSTG